MKTKCKGCGKEITMPFIYDIFGKEDWYCDEECEKIEVRD